MKQKILIHKHIKPVEYNNPDANISRSMITFIVKNILNFLMKMVLKSAILDDEIKLLFNQVFENKLFNSINNPVNFLSIFRAIHAINRYSSVILPNKLFIIYFMKWLESNASGSENMR